MLLLAGSGSGARSAEPSADPIQILLQDYPRERGEGLARAEPDLVLIAESFEAFRAPIHAERSREAAAERIAPELRPFFKDRDTILDTVYRTLAVAD
ncbi:MAG: hypothetical protein PHU21_14840, partial [Elusimicrobia bacterium]|nr:hypothetical protein [Elusimicrobiota bacterium]